MSNTSSNLTVVDSRLAIYRGMRQLMIIVLAGVFIKSCIFDTVAVKGDQMSPVILGGDRILMYRTPFLPVMRSVLKPARGKPAVFSHPFVQKKRGCLRIAGISGDTISIDSGRFSNTHAPDMKLAFQKSRSEIIPADFLPRDFMNPYRIPAPGDSVFLDTLGLRDYFFSVAALRQENPEAVYTIKTDLFIDSNASNDYSITEFSIYKGRFDSIPDHFQHDWFFWDRLQEYLKQTLGEGHHATISFSLLENGIRRDRFVVKSSFVFLVADNWSSGLDSRYTGPVRASLLEGRPLLVLWSVGQTANSRTGLKTNRLGRIIQ